MCCNPNNNGRIHQEGTLIIQDTCFDVPPKKLKTDTLRKKLMISEIKRSETQTQFYERGMVLMGHLKEFLGT